jgi:predicted ATPase/class 3 adenylate cyclase/DNA-binding CsgD family transcriptional regulator
VKPRAANPKRQQPPERGPSSAGPNPELPVGTLTFVMTDIEGSTRIWEVSPKVARHALGRHDHIVEEQVKDNHGDIIEFGREGDGILAVFKHATDAVACGVNIERQLQREVWAEGIQIRVRIAIHTGESDLRSGHYVGGALYRCGRLLATAHGGQVLISRPTKELVVDSMPEGITLLDLGEHRLRDFSRLEHVYQLQHADLISAFPPLKSLEPERTNLPSPLTSFVGRQADIGALRKLIKEARLITLLGPGGIGKSRLAIEVARGESDRWPDGVWWVDLTSIEDPQQVPGAVAEALNIRGNGPALQVVNSWLKRKRTLLVLDNCEHVVAGCAELGRTALEHCPELSILATSREPVGISGERRWPIAPLSEPDAMSLFEQRGRLVFPDFTVAEGNRNEVAHICRRLDELPLAIELAASRLGVMSERDISSQLVQGFDLLSARRSDQSRHRTMTATIDWSYRLLSEDEAALFRRLSVFHGGFTLESAAKVCADQRVPDVTGSLASLVEKSMVVVDRLEDGDTRYRLLDVQHTYAEEKLASSEESERIQQSHYKYFLAADAIHGPVSGGGGLLVEKRKRRETANVWAALKWAREHEPDLGLSLASEVGFVFDADLARSRRWLTDLLARSPSQGRARVVATLFAAKVAGQQGDANEHLRLAQAAKEMAREAGETGELAMAIHDIGMAQQDLGQLEAAETAFNEALTLTERSSDIRSDLPILEYINNDLGCLRLCQGRFQEARTLLADRVTSLRAHPIQSVFTLSATLESLASAELGCGEIDRAEEIWREALGIARQVDDSRGVIVCMGGLARSATARGDHLRALRLAAAHARLSEEFSRRDQTWWLEQLGHSQEISRAKLGSQKSDAAWKEGTAMSLERAIEYALEDRANVEVDSGVLSRREIEVARLVSLGATNREIGVKLFLSERTIEGHVDRIRNKLGFRSRAEIAAWAVERGLAGQERGSR